MLTLLFFLVKAGLELEKMNLVRIRPRAVISNLFVVTDPLKKLSGLRP